MAVINPNRNFEGSNLDNNSGFGYIKPEIRQLQFGEKKNPDGLYVFFLPGYKADANGNGVWFKKISVRDNFGNTNFKRKYFVKDETNDPATYFEKQFKGLYPDEAKPKEATDGKGRKTKAYPSYGRLTNRVVFNVALYNELSQGQPIDKTLFVFDLPVFNGADQLMKWMSTPGLDGQLNPIINDPNAAIPVFIKLNSGAGASPWQINPTADKRFQIPVQYADSDNLYNLDDIFIEKTDEEILSDLRSFYPGDLFDTCMKGSKWITASKTPVLRTAPADDLNYNSGPVVATTPNVAPVGAPPLPTVTAFPSPAPAAPSLPTAPVASAPVVTAPAVASMGAAKSVSPVNKEQLTAFLKA